jgi:hypothetical protein
MLIRCLALVVCGAVCVASGATADAFDGTYIGKRTLTKGDPGACVRQEDVSVTINPGTLTFTDSTLKKYTIGFELDPDGSFRELHVGLGGALVDIQGRIAANILDADVTNATCEHHWHLQKK